MFRCVGKEHTMAATLADGLKATLGGTIAHDQELSIRAEMLPEAWVRMELPFAPALTVPEDGHRISSGPLVTLLDTVCGVAAMARLGFEETVATLDLRVDYLHPVAAGENVVARAQGHHVSGIPGRGSLLVSAKAYTGDCVVAQAIGRFIRRKLPRDTAPRKDLVVRRLDHYSGYRELMGFVPDADGALRLPFREGLIGNGSLPSLHGGALAAHLQDAADRAVAATGKRQAVSTAHFTFQTFGEVADVIARAQIERRGSSATFASARSFQATPSRTTASAAFTYFVE
jgi:uncharacterized protein (TIGR00369 family)